MDFNDNKAIYLQIADLLTENILLGKWKPDDRIPSVREMAISIEVNPNTVMRTYNYLQEKEVIFNKRGIGFFVANDGLKKTMALRKEAFLKQELPNVFKEMRLLELDLDDIKSFYEEYSKKNKS